MPLGSGTPNFGRTHHDRDRNDPTPAPNQGLPHQPAPSVAKASAHQAHQVQVRDLTTC